jgi:UDP-galactopyranose mutase
MKYDWIIVGAGYTGAVIARELAQNAGKKVLLIDRRNHIAGNAHDARNEDGLLYHVYGPHIFHTNSQMVSDYLSKYTEWTFYEHRVLGVINERQVPIPFNFTSIDVLFSKDKATRLKNLLETKFGYGTKVTIQTLTESNDAELKEIADFVYQNVFLGYTTKQWGMPPEALNASVTARVPVNVSYDDRYFNDSFQFMPKHGYTKMFENILNHPNIHVELNTEWKDIKDNRNGAKVLFTGALDEFCDYKFGELPYRSLNFDFFTLKQPRHLAVAQLNYPNSQDYTRICEMNYLTGEFGDKTVISLEYPQAHIPGKTVPYYPIPRPDNLELHKKYVNLVKSSDPDIFFGGRLADYQYYNMDQAVGHALSMLQKEINAVI